MKTLKQALALSLLLAAGNVMCLKESKAHSRKKADTFEAKIAARYGTKPASSSKRINQDPKKPVKKTDAKPNTVKASSNIEENVKNYVLETTKNNGSIKAIDSQDKRAATTSSVKTDGEKSALTKTSESQDARVAETTSVDNDAAKYNSIDPSKRDEDLSKSTANAGRLAKVKSFVAGKTAWVLGQLAKLPGASKVANAWGYNYPVKGYNVPVGKIGVSAAVATPAVLGYIAYKNMHSKPEVVVINKLDAFEQAVESKDSELTSEAREAVLEALENVEWISVAAVKTQLNVVSNNPKYLKNYIELLKGQMQKHLENKDEKSLWETAKDKLAFWN